MTIVKCRSVPSYGDSSMLVSFLLVNFLNVCDLSNKKTNGATFKIQQTKKRVLKIVNACKRQQQRKERQKHAENIELVTAAAAAGSVGAATAKACDDDRATVAEVLEDISGMFTFYENKAIVEKNKLKKGLGTYKRKAAGESGKNRVNNGGDATLNRKNNPRKKAARSNRRPLTSSNQASGDQEMMTGNEEKSTTAVSTKNGKQINGVRRVATRGGTRNKAQRTSVGKGKGKSVQVVEKPAEKDSNEDAKLQLPYKITNADRDDMTESEVTERFETKHYVSAASSYEMLADSNFEDTMEGEVDGENTAGTYNHEAKANNQAETENNVDIHKDDSSSSICAEGYRHNSTKNNKCSLRSANNKVEPTKRVRPMTARHYNKERKDRNNSVNKQSEDRKCKSSHTAKENSECQVKSSNHGKAANDEIELVSSENSESEADVLTSFVERDNKPASSSEGEASEYEVNTRKDNDEMVKESDKSMDERDNVCRDKVESTSSAENCSSDEEKEVPYKKGRVKEDRKVERGKSPSETGVLQKLRGRADADIVDEKSSEEDSCIKETSDKPSPGQKGADRKIRRRKKQVNTRKDDDEMVKESDKSTDERNNVCRDKIGSTSSAESSSSDEEMEAPCKKKGRDKEDSKVERGKLPSETSVSQELHGSAHIDLVNEKSSEDDSYNEVTSNKPGLAQKGVDRKIKRRKKQVTTDLGEDSTTEESSISTNAENSESKSITSEAEDAQDDGTRKETARSIILIESSAEETSVQKEQKQEGKNSEAESESTNLDSESTYEDGSTSHYKREPDPSSRKTHSKASERRQNEHKREADSSSDDSADASLEDSHKLTNSQEFSDEEDIQDEHSSIVDKPTHEMSSGVKTTGAFKGRKVSRTASDDLKLKKRQLREFKGGNVQTEAKKQSVSSFGVTAVHTKGKHKNSTNNKTLNVGNAEKIPRNNKAKTRSDESLQSKQSIEIEELPMKIKPKSSEKSGADKVSPHSDSKEIKMKHTIGIVSNKKSDVKRVSLTTHNLQRKESGKKILADCGNPVNKNSLHALKDKVKLNKYTASGAAANIGPESDDEMKREDRNNSSDNYSTSNQGKTQIMDESLTHKSNESDKTDSDTNSDDGGGIMKNLCITVLPIDNDELELGYALAEKHDRFIEMDRDTKRVGENERKNCDDELIPSEIEVTTEQLIDMVVEANSPKKRGDCTELSQQSPSAQTKKKPVNGNQRKKIHNNKKLNGGGEKKQLEASGRSIDKVKMIRPSSAGVTANAEKAPKNQRIRPSTARPRTAVVDNRNAKAITVTSRKKVESHKHDNRGKEKMDADERNGACGGACAWPAQEDQKMSRVVAEAANKAAVFEGELNFLEELMLADNAEEVAALDINNFIPTEVNTQVYLDDELSFTSSTSERSEEETHDNYNEPVKQKKGLLHAMKKKARKVLPSGKSSKKRKPGEERNNTNVDVLMNDSMKKQNSLRRDHEDESTASTSKQVTFNNETEIQTYPKRHVTNAVVEKPRPKFKFYNPAKTKVKKSPSKKSVKPQSTNAQYEKEAGENKKPASSSRHRVCGFSIRKARTKEDAIPSDGRSPYLAPVLPPIKSRTEIDRIAKERDRLEKAAEEARNGRSAESGRRGSRLNRMLANAFKLPSQRTRVTPKSASTEDHEASDHTKKLYKQSTFELFSAMRREYQSNDSQESSTAESAIPPQASSSTTESTTGTVSSARREYSPPETIQILANQLEEIDEEPSTVLIEDLT